MMNAFVIAKKGLEYLESPVLEAGDDNQQEAIAVFTQRELAAKYIDDAGWQDEYEVGELLPIQLVHWLAAAHEDGTDMVVVNPDRRQHLAGTKQLVIDLKEPFGTFAELLSSKFIHEADTSADGTSPGSDAANATGGTKPTSEKRLPDDVLQSNVESTLLNDPRLSLHPIEISVSDGTITLRGNVQSHRRKLLAQQITASHDGVQAVRNQLVVSPPEPITDDEVADQVRLALDSCADVTKETVTVSVVAGKATLQGTVGNIWEQAVADDVARSVRGVRDVINLLTVDKQCKIDDHELANSIKAALRRDRGLRGLELGVAVDDNVVTLTGRVPHLWQREAAEAVTRQFGLLHTRNDIEVVT
jgi:osmotically-inducible protein OsmY